MKTKTKMRISILLTIVGIIGIGIGIGIGRGKSVYEAHRISNLPLKKEYESIVKDVGEVCSIRQKLSKIKASEINDNTNKKKNTKN